MSKKKVTRLEKSTTILIEAKATQWCYVNIDNEFNFMNQIFIINNNVDEYKVHNKAWEVEDFTNEAYMEEILVIMDKNNNLKFYNQNYDLIDSRLITTL